MTAKTLQDIINIDSSKISISDFIDFLKNVDMEFPTPSANKEYILYAGKIGDQPISRAFFGNEEVFDVAKTTPGKALIDIAKNGVLRKKLEDAISNDYRKIGVNDFDADRIKKTMYYFMSGEIENSISTEPSFQKLKNHLGNPERFWDITSARYVKEAPQGVNFRILAGTDNFNIDALNRTVLMRVELENLLKRNDVLVNGASINSFKIGTTIEQAKTALYAKMAAQTLLASFPIGNFNYDLYKKLSNEEFAARFLNDLSTESRELFNKRISDIYKELDIPHVDAHAAKTSKSPKRLSGAFKHLGIIGLAVGLIFAAQEAKAADAAGDHERAKDIMAEWAVGEAGSSAAGAAATFLTTLAGTALLGLSGPVAAVAGVAVGIVAGIYGEDAAKELYRLTKDMDHNGRMDLFDRLGTLAFGQDFKPNEIPEMLQKQAVSLKPEISLEEFVRKAKSDIAYRYALRELNTFVAEGADYTPFNQKGTLNLWDAENPSANPQGMTENYIRDRARMALLQMRYLKNGLKLARDLTDDMVQGDWDFMDHSKHPYAGDIDRPLTFSIDGNGITTDDHRVVFGSNGSDDKEYDKVNLEGSGRDDRIYGLGGNDRLIGKDGNDYLEGGEGDDTYVLSSKESGVDTILDTDGKGALEVDERRLANLNFAKPDVPISSANSGKIYYADDGKYRFSHVDGTQWLFAARDANGGYKPLTYINHWKNGDLGIKVDETGNPGVEPESAYFMMDNSVSSLFYDYTASLSPTGVRIHGSNRVSAGFNGSPHNDVIFTGNGSLHYVIAGGGKDYIQGGTGHEVILGGANNPDLQNDDDTIYGGGNTDTILGGAGNDTLWADDGTDSYETPVNANSDWRGDWVSGQYGSDAIFGSARKDMLFGGEGHDTIRGGAGDDLILGDANYTPNSRYLLLGNARQPHWQADGSIRIYKGGLSVPNSSSYDWDWASSENDFAITHAIGMRDTDRIQGTGNDVLHGGEGNDWMAGQAGSDVLYGGAGNDTMFGDDSVAMPEGFASGDDKLYAGSGADKLHGGAGHDLLDASEKDGEKDQLFGDDGNDELKGGTGGDELHGGAGDDLLRASGEDQTLMDGGRGNDAFYGGIGDDTMRDEDGNDHYVLSPGNDTIDDQGNGYDTYQLSFGNLFYSGTTTIRDSDGKGKIFYRGQAITADRVYAVSETEWYTDDDTFKLKRSGNDLVITNATPGSQGRAIFNGFFNSEEFLGLKLPPLHDDNKPEPDPKPDPKPQPEQPQAPTAGKPLAAQSVHEKEKLTYTLAEDAFHTANQDDKLTYSARLADGKPLPGWLSFNPQTRTFSGTPSNDDVGMLNVEISAKGKGGSANQRFTLNVINVNDAPQIGTALANQQGTGGKPWQYRLPTDAFHDIDKGDVLSLTAALDDGQPLPSWLAFDAATGQFSATLPKEAKTSAYRIAVTATDKAGAQAKQAFNLDITPPANTAPQAATTIVAQKVNEKSRWQFTLPANAFRDPDGDTLSYTATLADGKALPEWLHFDAARQTFSGTPGNDDVGNFSIRVTATDGRGGSAAQNFALEVVNVNDAPQIGATLANQQGTGGKPWQYRLPANAFRDIDKDDVLTLSAKLDNGQPLPSWLKFDGKTGQFSATLPKEAKASAYRIAVTATDKAGAQAKQAFNLDITPPANTAPQAATTIAAQKTNEKSRWQFTLPANAFRDPDGDTLTYTASLTDGKALPKWLHFDAARQTFSGTPGNDDVGNLSIRVTAADGRGGSSMQNFALEVVNVNDAPQIGTELKGQTIIGGELWQYRLPIDAFKDIDKDDVLTLSVRLGDSSGGGNLPTWLTFDAKTGLFKGTPSNENEIYQIKVTATDKFGANVSQEFPLQVAEKKSYLYGSEKDDKIFGAGGNEHIYGYGGNDILWGKAGNDTIYAGSGDDVVNGEDGNDHLFGDAGNDRLIGGNGNDRLGGGQGDDILDGGSGNDYLYGDEGNDIYRFMGNYGHDSINNSFGSKGDVDVIEFPDRRLQDVIITRNEDHLIIKDLYYNNQITVIKHFQKDSHYYIHRIRFADGSHLDYDAINRLAQGNNNPPRANLVQDRYAATSAARQAQVMMQAMAASGAQPLDNLMTPDNPPLVPSLLSNLKP